VFLRHVQFKLPPVVSIAILNERSDAGDKAGPFELKALVAVAVLGPFNATGDQYIIPCSRPPALVLVGFGLPRTASGATHVQGLRPWCWLGLAYPGLRPGLLMFKASGLGVGWVLPTPDFTASRHTASGATHVQGLRPWWASVKYR
jgi:hypothetical protein